MKVHNCFILSLCSLIILGVISSCTPFQDKVDIYDNNEKIAEDGDHYSFGSRVGTVDSNDSLDLTYDDFSGSQTIWTLETNEAAEVSFSLDSKVNSGDFKVVLVSPEKNVETILSGSLQDQMTVELNKGKYILKLVGRNAAGEIMITVEPTQNVVVTQVSDGD